MAEGIETKEGTGTPPEGNPPEGTPTPPATEDNGTGTPSPEGGEKKPSEAKYTDDDLSAAVKKAVADTKAEMEKQAKLAKLPEDEQAKEKLKQDREQLDKDRAELDRRILIQKTEDMLSEKGLSRKFAKYFAGADEKETKKTVEAFEKDFNEAVNAKVDVQLKGGKPPKAGGGGDPVDAFLAGLGL